MFSPLKEILSTEPYTIELPSKKSEKWRFSSIKNYLDRDYQLVRDPFKDAKALGFSGNWGYFCDGKFIKGSLPASVTIQEQTKHTTVKNNPFAYIATVSSDSALELVFSEDVTLSLILDYSDEIFATSSFNLIIKEGVTVTLDVKFIGGKAGFVSHSSHIELQPRSDLHLTQTQNFAADAVCISQNSFDIQEHALCKAFVLLYSGEYLHHFNQVQLGFESEIDMTALLLAKGQQKEIFSCDINHLADRSKSHLYAKEVLRDSAVGVFDASTVVAKDTKKSSVYQASHALLLGDKAQIHSKPHLEIYSDDLTASHGSTVGELDIQALAYLCSRGISEAKAKEILVDAFIQELVDRVDEASKEAVQDLLGGSHV